MTNIRVIATVTYDFDTEDGLVTNEESALEQVRELIDEGGVHASDFEYEVSRSMERSPLDDLLTASHSVTPPLDDDWCGYSAPFLGRCSCGDPANHEPGGRFYKEGRLPDSERKR